MKNLRCRASLCPNAMKNELHVVCRNHWKLVPEEMKEKLREEERKRSKELRRGIGFSQSYFKICAEIVEYLAEKEKKPKDNVFSRALKMHRMFKHH